MKALILAGGRGSRLVEETVTKPKPMVEVGNRPLLWHIMRHYAYFGFCDFVVALGYKGSEIKQYFLNYRLLNSHLTVDLRTGQVHAHDDGNLEAWTAELVETGLETQTGGRIKRVAQWIGNETFMMTYGDGVANVNLKDLLAFHRSKGCLATVTAVRPPSRFGGLRIQHDVVTEFVEKPQIWEGWINGGFFVLEPGVLDYIEGDETIFEREPLERLAKDGQLAAYQHHGFWQCVDTLRDLRLLEELWRTNQAAWRLWT